MSPRRSQPKRQLAAAAVACACAGASCADPPVPQGPQVLPSSTATGTKPDALGGRPALLPSRPYTPPTAEVFRVRVDAASGAEVEVWHLDRPALPLVSLSVVVQVGSADDPPKQRGLAYLTADMLDEGAAGRSAAALASAFDDLGTSLWVSPGTEATTISVTTLASKFDAALALAADVVRKPNLAPTDFRRVHGLWQNSLTARASEATRVASLTMNRALFGADHPYGHPVDGFLASKGISLGDVKAFHAARYRPDALRVVVVGDLRREALERAIAQAFAGFSLPKAASPRRAPPSPTPSSAKVILVDRPNAPQSVVMTGRLGLAAGAPEAPELELVNIVLGGSFTSRLNANLREAKGWTYGARSSFRAFRSGGTFVARAEVLADKTLEALQEMDSELARLARSGLDDAELTKARAQANADFLETYASTANASSHLAELGSLGLLPTDDATALAASRKATTASVARLGDRFVPTQMVRVIVGPVAELRARIPASWGPVETWDPEGNRKP
jgi:zinc protease